MGMVLKEWLLVMERAKVRKLIFPSPLHLLIFGCKQIFRSDLFLPAKQGAILVGWMKNILPDLSLPKDPSEEDLRTCLIDGTVLCRILDRLRPGSVDKVVESYFIILIYQDTP